MERTAGTLGEAAYVLQEFGKYLSPHQQQVLQQYLYGKAPPGKVQGALGRIRSLTQSIALAQMVVGDNTSVSYLVEAGNQLLAHAIKPPVDNALTLYFGAAGFPHHETAKIMEVSPAKVAVFERDAVKELRGTYHREFVY